MYTIGLLYTDPTDPRFHVVTDDWGAGERARCGRIVDDYISTVGTVGVGLNIADYELLWQMNRHAKPCPKCFPHIRWNQELRNRITAHLRPLSPKG